MELMPLGTLYCLLEINNHLVWSDPHHGDGSAADYGGSCYFPGGYALWNTTRKNWYWAHSLLNYLNEESVMTCPLVEDNTSFSFGNGRLSYAYNGLLTTKLASDGTVERKNLRISAVSKRSSKGSSTAAQARAVAQIRAILFSIVVFPQMLLGRLVLGIVVLIGGDCTHCFVESLH